MYRLYHEKNQYLKSAALRGRRARYEEFWAIDDVSFEIPEGSSFGIIGSNGSGKSSLLKCLAGILTPDKGQIAISGSLSALLELGAGFHPDLSGIENIYLNGAILGMNRHAIDKRLDEIVDFAGLSKFIDSPVKNYSSGMVVRLGFAIAASVEPDVLLIDEVLAVGDEAFQRRCGEKIEQFRRDGRTIILVSHGLSQIQQLCTTTAWLDSGKLKKIGDTNEVVSDYIGTSHEAVPNLNSERGNRWGSGAVNIQSVVISGIGDSANGILTSGEPGTISIEYFANEEVLDGVIGIRVTHVHGFNVWGSNTKRAGVGPLKFNGTGTATFSFENLPLLDGTYDLTIALSDMSEVNEFDHWDRSVRFEVRQGRIPDEGVARIQGAWSI
jgi:ABC-2 type transport system ATP-binding protein